MNTIKYLFLGLLTAAFLHLLMNASCLEIKQPTEPPSNKNVDINKINESAAAVENAFINQDTTKLISTLSSASLEIYKDIIKELYPYMKQYGEVFKTRKLINYTEIFAVYSFKGEDGKEFTATFTKVDDGSWKLVRF